jgi:hypothetical protein
MTEFIQNYNFNSLFVLSIVLLYNIWYSNYDDVVHVIHIISSKLYVLNFSSLIIVLIQVFGLYLFLKNVSFDISIKCSVKYK